MRSASPLVISLVWLVASLPARADTRKDTAAIARLGAAAQPVFALTGTARTDRACSDIGELQAAVAALPHKAPTRSVVDDETWRTAVDGLALSAENLAGICKTPDRRVKHLGGKVDTAEAVVAEIEESVRLVEEQARPRDLPPVLQTFKRTFASMRASSKQLCVRQARLAKLSRALATPPAQADAEHWKRVHAALATNLDELSQFACGSPRGADEEIAGALHQIHDNYYQLALLVPPRPPAR